MPHYYLSDYIGTGTRADPFRPRGSDQPGWSAIDLRPRGDLVSGRCLLALPVRADPIGQRYLGDDLQTNSTIATHIGNDLGITVTNRRLHQIIFEILTNHARRDGTRWKPLSDPTGERVFLGGFIDNPRRGERGIVITENWNCADSDSISCNLSWTELEPDIDLVSNQARSVTLGTEVSARAESDLATANHFAQAVVDANEDTGEASPGVFVRKDATATLTYYVSFAIFRLNTLDLDKRIAGLYTILGTVAETLTPGSPGTLKCQANGSTVTLWWNGTQRITVTDTDITGNLRTGIDGLKNVADFVSWDNFQAADVNGAGGMVSVGSRKFLLLRAGK